jgi:hypothetical protein
MLRRSCATERAVGLRKRQVEQVEELPCWQVTPPMDIQSSRAEEAKKND